MNGTFRWWLEELTWKAIGSAIFSLMLEELPTFNRKRSRVHHFNCTKFWAIHGERNVLPALEWMADSKLLSLSD